jgi:hypothetical protein
MKISLRSFIERKRLLGFLPFAACLEKVTDTLYWREYMKKPLMNSSAKV